MTTSPGLHTSPRQPEQEIPTTIMSNQELARYRISANSFNWNAKPRFRLRNEGRLNDEVLRKSNTN